VYKKTKIISGRANKESQEQFEEEFIQMMSTKALKTKVFQRCRSFSVYYQIGLRVDKIGRGV
jgi:hypothetical protein